MASVSAPSTGGDAVGNLITTLWQGLAMVAALGLIGWFLLPRLFAQAARAKNPELFLAASLLVVIAAALATLGLTAFAADTLTTRNPNPSAPAANAGGTFDAAKELPRYPAIAASDAVATWKVKPGFKLEFVTHEPQVRDPIAISFDENGRMFVCEMIDYSERRDATPHLGRISMLEDKDGDGVYETSTVFADDLPLPTGLIWANGGLFVAASPNIWRFEDRDGDGRARKGSCPAVSDRPGSHRCRLSAGRSQRCAGAHGRRGVCARAA